MATYTVKAGDTLLKIASGKLGAAGKWRAIAEMNGIINPANLRVGQRLVLPGKAVEVPAVVHTAEGVHRASNERIRITIEHGIVYATSLPKPEKVFVGRLHRKGLNRIGLLEPETFILNYREKLQDINLTDSEVNVMLAVAENVGCMDAVNTWDDQYISFGIFLWRAGGPGKPGELASLMKVVKDRFPDDYQHYWAQFGLDVTDVGSKTGWLTYRGSKLVSAEDKGFLRDHVWACRFARAGADLEIQAAQIQHAVNRIHQFYFVKSSQLDGYALADLITSEFGVALLLDNHVDRPGYVRSCVAYALGRSKLSAAELAAGGDAEEQRVINHYLEVRESYGRRPMADARQRANVTRGYVVDGIISTKRNSFISGRAGNE
jgi:LysM repeat protein